MEALQQQAPMRERVERLEQVLEGYPQAHCPIRHHFADGMYLREMFVPAGTIATGAVHKTEHLTIVVGHCWFTTEDGARELKGHSTLLSKPGAKRAITAVSDCILTTIHPNPTNETDPRKLCEMLTESKADELLGGSHNRQLLSNGVLQ